MAPVLAVRYLLRVTHQDGLYVRTDPTPSPDPSARNRVYTVPMGAWVPAYDVLPLQYGVYAVIVASQLKSEFVRVAEKEQYDSVTGQGTYARVYALAPTPYNPHTEQLEALRDIAKAIRGKYDAPPSTD